MRTKTTTIKDMTPQGVALSVALHLAIVGAGYVGLPFMQKDPPVEAPLIVDLVPIDEITAAPPKPAPEPKPEAPKEEVQPEPPKPVDAERPNPEQMPPEPEEKPLPPPPKETAEAPPPPKIQPPPPKPKPTKPKKDDWSELQSLVKNLEKSKPQEKKQEQQQASVSQSDAKVIAPQISDRATMTEQDAIRRHIESCWRIDPGAEGLENLSADLRVFINPDGSVQKVEIVDMGRYFVDAQFRTFVNSARYAVQGCGNIPISPQRYSVFKEMTMTFSPQGRIN